MCVGLNKVLSSVIISMCCDVAVLDTSAILFLLQKRVDILDAVLSAGYPVCKVVVPEVVIDELKTIASKGGSERARLARIGLRYLEAVVKERRGIMSIVEISRSKISRGSVDDALISWAEEKSAVLVTADIKLKNRALEKGIRVLVPMLSKKRLMEY